MTHHLLPTLLRRTLSSPRFLPVSSARFFHSSLNMPAASSSKRKVDAASASASGSDADEPVPKKKTTTASKAAPKKAAKEPKEPVSHAVYHCGQPECAQRAR
jgi:hypothetical protein